VNRLEGLANERPYKVEYFYANGQVSMVRHASTHFSGTRPESVQAVTLGKRNPNVRPRNENAGQGLADV